MERVEIRVARWKMALAILGIVGFVVLGLWIIAIGDIVEKTAGLLCVVFVGGFGAYTLLKGAKGRQRLTLTSAGIEIGLPGMASRVVPWRDIETFGVTRIAKQEFTTIRLSSYTAFLDGIADDDARAAIRFFNSLRAVSYATVAVAAVNAEDASDVPDFLKGSEKAQSVATLLSHSRRTFGGEFLLGWNVRDRGAKEFADYLEGLRRANSTR